MLLFAQIGEASYCFLLADSALVALVLKGFNRLRELDLRNMKIILADIEKAKDGLAVRKAKFKSVLIPFIQIIAYSSSIAGRWGSLETNKLNRMWYKNKLKCLVNELGIESVDAQEIQKFVNKYDEIDEILEQRGEIEADSPDADKTKHKLEVLMHQIVEVLQEDIEKEEA